MFVQSKSKRDMTNTKRVKFTKELFEVYGIEAVIYRNGKKPDDVLISELEIKRPIISIINGGHYTHAIDGSFYLGLENDGLDLFIEVPTEQQPTIQYLVAYEPHAACLMEKHELIHILAFIVAEFTDPEKEPKKDFSLTIKSVKDGTDN
jgi:hypothetical protein